VPRPSWTSFGGDSGCSVVEEDAESSASDELDGDGDGDVARVEDAELGVVNSLDRIFWVILVSENGLACG
jgi:hypothetical protein